MWIFSILNPTQRPHVDMTNGYRVSVFIGNLSHLPGDDDLLCLPIEINKRLFIDDDQPVVISIG